MNAEQQKFFDKVIPVTESGCWLWNGAVSNRGYGNFGIGRKTFLAHRTSFELFSGPIPRPLWVLHRCDVRSCVNPAHLFLATHKENMADMSRKGRSGKKLTRADAEELRRLYASGAYSHSGLGRLFGVNHRNVGRIVRGEMWA